MKRAKTIQVTSCDVCESDNGLMWRCSLCASDICKAHTSVLELNRREPDEPHSMFAVVNLPPRKSAVFGSLCLCPSCFEKTIAKASQDLGFTHPAAYEANCSTG